MTIDDSAHDLSRCKLGGHSHCRRSTARFPVKLDPYPCNCCWSAAKRRPTRAATGRLRARRTTCWSTCSNPPTTRRSKSRSPTSATPAGWSVDAHAQCGFVLCFRHCFGCQASLLTPRCELIVTEAQLRGRNMRRYVVSPGFFALKCFEGVLVWRLAHLQFAIYELRLFMTQLN